MADIIKIFYEYGKTFEKDLVNNFNQIDSKNIDKILEIDLKDYNYFLHDKSNVTDRLVLYIISSAGGNLFPFVYMGDKLFDNKEKGKKGGLSKSLENLAKYINSEDKEKLNLILNKSDFPKICSIIKEIEIPQKEKYYLALSYDGKFFNEIFDYIFEKFIKSKEEVNFDGYCYIENRKTKIGFDPQLNFCSLNELSDSMSNSIKPRILSLSSDAGQLVTLGFEKIFSDFRFKIMGLNYILLPTILINNISLKENIFNFIRDSRKFSEDATVLKSRKILEEDLEYLVDDLTRNKLEDSVLLSFLFYRKNNKEIIVYHTIEDVAPSKITVIAEYIDEEKIDISQLSKYHKKQFKEQNPELLFLRDYISDRLMLAKLIFGREYLGKDFVIKSIFNKIFFGNNLEEEKRDFSLIINGYFKDDTDYKKHQRFIDFLSKKLNVCNHFNLGGDDMNYKTLKELVEGKLENVSLMKDNVEAKEFYILGLLSALVIAVQKSKNTSNDFKSSLESFLNSIGVISNLNKDRIFNKIIDGAKKYEVYGNDWDFLLGKYSDIKSSINNRKVPIETGNILFVMGNIDYKKLRKDNKQENNHE